MSDDPFQPELFEKGEWWGEHWKGMPEFVQKDLMPWKTVYVHFEKAEDMQTFSRLVSQDISQDTKFIWFPESDARARSVGRFATKCYIDSVEETNDFLDTVDEG